MTDRWRIGLGGLLILLGMAGLLLGFGPLQFADRFTGRVEAAGVVQWGLDVEATSPEDTIDDGEYGAWKVDYLIDGSNHTGVIVGEYRAGQRIVVSAPADGSIYSPLREGTPTGLKVLSWLVVPGSLVLIGFGGRWLTRGMRSVDVRNREVARRQLALRYPQLFGPEVVRPPATGGAPATWGEPVRGGDPVTGADPVPERPPGPADPAAQRREQPGGGMDFFAPYDI